MVIPQLEQQLLQLSANDKLYIIKLLAESLTNNDNNTQSKQPSKLSEFFRQSPLVGIAEELDFSRDSNCQSDYAINDGVIASATKQSQVLGIASLHSQ